MRAVLTRVRALPVRGRIAAGVVALLALVAALGGLVAPYDPTSTDAGPRAVGPSWAYPLGTDQLGRDVLSRVIAGARVSVVTGFAAVLIALLAAALIGSVAAVAHRWAGESIMRVLDVVMAFPAVIIAACVAAVVHPGLVTTVAVIAALYTPPISRVVRANVLAQYGEDYVEAARSVGSSQPRILTRQVAINCAAPILVFAATMVADAIVLESSLSFLGLGIQPPAPSWGNIINDGRELLFSGGWWLCAFPGLAIFVSVLTLNLLAESVSDALAAPKRADDAGTEPVRVVTRDRDDLLTEDGRSDVLQVDRLTITFPGVHGDVPVVSDVSFDVGEGEIVGMVGESGCGKSLIGLTLMGLQPPGAEVTGRVLLRGQDLLSLTPRRRRALLGAEIAMIYQDALSALNPGMTVGRQLAQMCRLGGERTPAELLDLVGLPSSALRAHPNRLSGGQRQRVLIAMSLARSPSLLVADEPTTALDETIQAQVVELLTDLQRDLGFSVLLITHDLALAADVARRVLVMYAGQLVEAGLLDRVTTRPRHPYTAGLLAAITSLEERAERLVPIPGTVPSPAEFGAGCRFAGRCDRATDACDRAAPDLLRLAVGQYAACLFPESGAPVPESDEEVRR